MIGSDASPLSTLEDPVPQSTLIKVDSKRCWSVGPLKHPTSSAAARRALRNAVGIIDHIGSSCFVNRVDVIGRKHGRNSVKFIALAGGCLRFAHNNDQVHTTAGESHVWDRLGQGHCRSVSHTTRVQSIDDYKANSSKTPRQIPRDIQRGKSSRSKVKMKNTQGITRHEERR